MQEQVSKIGVKNNLPPRIAARMKALGIRSVPHLAEISGIPAPTLYNILGGRSEMGLRTAVLLSRALRMSLEYLAEITLGDIDEITQSDKLLSDRIKTYKISSSYGLLGTLTHIPYH